MTLPAINPKLIANVTPDDKMGSTKAAESPHIMYPGPIIFSDICDQSCTILNGSDSINSPSARIFDTSAHSEMFRK